jgi:hypothetical protein
MGKTAVDLTLRTGLPYETGRNLSPAMHCPLCRAELPDDATSCTRCDWVRDLAMPEFPRDDWIAAALSFVPGLGHLYKGHLIPGILLLLILGPLYLLAVFWLVPHTFGASLLLPAVFVAVCATHAYRLADVRRDPGMRRQAELTLAKWLGRGGDSIARSIK